MTTFLSDFHRDLMLNIFRGTAFPSVLTNSHAALYNGDPGRAGTGGTDVTTIIRTLGRLAIPVANWSAPATDGSGRRFIQNTVAIDFGTAAGTATVTHLGFWSASSGGNFLGGFALPNSPLITAGSPCIFPINAVRIRGL